LGFACEDERFFLEEDMCVANGRDGRGMLEAKPKDIGWDKKNLEFEREEEFARV
jgi:hypothetical protein